MKNIKKYNSVIFLLVVLIIYIVIAFLNMNVILESLNFFKYQNILNELKKKKKMTII